MKECTHFKAAKAVFIAPFVPLDNLKCVRYSAASVDDRGRELSNPFFTPYAMKPLKLKQYFLTVEDSLPFHTLSNM